MEEKNIQSIVAEKKKWETPKAEVISNDTVKSGTVFTGPEGQPTVLLNHTYHS